MNTKTQNTQKQIAQMIQEFKISENSFDCLRENASIAHIAHQENTFINHLNIHKIK